MAKKWRSKKYQQIERKWRNVDGENGGGRSAQYRAWQKQKRQRRK
jgi:hypothetical protein